MLIWLRFCSWRLVEILRMKFDHDQDRCAFGIVWKQGSHKLQWNFQPGLYLPLYEPVEWKFLWKVTLVYWCSIMSKFLCKVTKKDINHAKVVYYGTELDVKFMESNVKSNHFMKVCILVQSICCCLMSQPLFYNFSYPSPYWENNFEFFGKQNILAMATTMTNCRKKKRMKMWKSGNHVSAMKVFGASRQSAAGASSDALSLLSLPRQLHHSKLQVEPQFFVTTQCYHFWNNFVTTETFPR